MGMLRGAVPNILPFDLRALYMQTPRTPADEPARQAALDALKLLDTSPEQRFDRLTRIARHHFGVPIALVSLIDRDRQWFKSRQGLDAAETGRDISFCGHAILSDDIFYVADTLEDPRFADNPLVTGGPRIRFYAGAPLHAPDGGRVGTLCIIDDKPRQPSEDELAILRDLADIAETEMARTHLMTSVREARESARLLDAVVDNLPVMLFVKRASDLRMVLFNRAGEKMCGFSREQLIGRNDRDNFPKEQADFFELKDRQVLNETGFLHIPEEVVTTKDGRQLTVRTVKVAIKDEQGRPQYLLGISEDITERKQGERKIHDQNRLLDAISRAQSYFIRNAQEQDTFASVLDDLLIITGSEYGFVGEVRHKDNGAPFLKTYALTDISWNDETKRFYEENAPKGLEFTNLDTLFGAVLKTRAPVIANDPSHDPRRGGLPPGHPPLNAFLGMPIFHGERMLGMAGLANRAGGYDEVLIDHLSPFLKVLGNLMEAMHAKKTVAAGEARIRAILDTVIDGIISIDARGHIQTANPAAEKIFGYGREEMLGRNVNMLMPEPYHSAHDGYLHSYLTTGRKKIIGIGREVTGRRKDGSTFPMDLAVSEMEVDGQRMFTGVVRDITERKRLERMKSEFVSTVSHELRTPLTSIRGAIGLVAAKYAETLPEKGRQMLEMAERNGERLTALINDLLDLEKIESGRMEFEFKPMDLVALARRAREDNDGYARSHDVRLRLATELVEAPVHGDELRLLQAFANLISNAVKYSPPAGEVEIAVTRREGGFRVAVRDHGPGIPEEFSSRIFQRFAQADSSDTREKGGTGLGLSITKVIVEKHGGHIDYSSRLGTGTEFFFDLPAAQPSQS